MSPMSEDLSEYRRELHELAARYENEPTLRDVYVEGEFDSTVVSWFFQEHGCDEVVVYEIDTVDVPVDVLKKCALDEGQKGRVIATCKELEAAGCPTQSVAGIVDRDCDALIGVTHNSPLLLFTD